MRSEVFFISSHGTYTIFLSGEAENTTFAVGRQERKWYFWPAKQKKVMLKFVVYTDISIHLL